MKTTRLITVVALVALALMASHATAQVQTNGAAGTPLVLPRPDFHFPANVGRTYPRLRPAAVPAAGAGAQGRTEHRADPARRRRLRAVQHVRRRRPVADDGQAGRRGAALQPLPHHGAVQPDAGGADHRPQPPLGVVRRHHRDWRPATTATPACCRRSCGTVGEVLRQNGYMTAWIGKNHNTPDLGDQRRRPVRPLGQRPRASTTSTASTAAT